MIPALQTELRIIRYELSDCEWTAIEPTPSGVPRMNDRRVLNAMLRAGAPRRDLPDSFGTLLVGCKAALGDPSFSQFHTVRAHAATFPLGIAARTERRKLMARAQMVVPRLSGVFFPHV